MAKKKVTAKAAGKSLVKWQERIREAAQESKEAANSFGGKSTFLSARGGRFSVGGEKLGDELSIVIMRWTFENDYYGAREFDPDNPQSPVCFAFGTVRKEMMPSKAASEKQNDTCAGCPQNEWGSSERGEGKACKNIVRFAFLTEGDLDDPGGAELTQYRVPVTSVANFRDYIKEIETKFGEDAAPLRFVTKMTVEADKKSQFKIFFELEKEIEDMGDEQAEAFFKKYDEAKELITADYPKPAENDEDDGRSSRRNKVRGAREERPAAKKKASGATDMRRRRA